MNRSLSFGLLPLLAVVLVSACATASRVKTAGEFVDGKQLATLERGVSTRRDVQRVLGAPDGSGHALLPTEETQLDLWYYADIEVTGVRQDAGGFSGDLRQQILLVAFRGDAFDGYMWWSNEGSLDRD